MVEGRDSLLAMGSFAWVRDSLLVLGSWLAEKGFVIAGVESVT